MTVIIPSKTASNLLPCVEAVRKHEPAARVIVIDDGLEFDDPDIWARGRLAATFLPGVKPFIFARNVNLGIAAAGDDDVVLLNDDALLQTPGGFAKMAEFAAAHEDCGAVVPATNITGQPLQWPQHATEEGYRWCQSVPYVCVYIPRRTLNAVGLLDERYCLDYGCEDADHLEAMRRAGLKAAILYSVYVDHGSLRSSFRGDPKTPASFVRNQALFNEKWGVAGP